MTTDQSWFDIGKKVGLDVVEEEEVEQEVMELEEREADEEVAKIQNEAEERKKVVLKGIKLNNLCVF